MSKLDQAVQERNVGTIRNLLKSYLSSDPADSDNTIQNSLKKIKSSGIDIWEAHDGKELRTQAAEWDEDYFVDQQVDLRMNFSEKRFMHMLEIGKKVYHKPAAETKGNTSQPAQKTIVLSVAGGKKNGVLMLAAAALGAAAILVISLIKIFNPNQ